MFDIGFPEMLLVALVVLLVFGPERLPEVLRSLGRWMSGARRSFNNLKAELEREVGADELRRDLHNSRVLEEAREMRDQVRAELRRTGGDLHASEQEIDDLVRQRMMEQPDSARAAGTRESTPEKPPEERS